MTMVEAVELDLLREKPSEDLIQIILDLRRERTNMCTVNQYISTELEKWMNGQNSNRVDELVLCLSDAQKEASEQKIRHRSLIESLDDVQQLLLHTIDSAR